MNKHKLINFYIKAKLYHIYQIKHKFLIRLLNNLSFYSCKILFEFDFPLCSQYCFLCLNTQHKYISSFINIYVDGAIKQ